MSRRLIPVDGNEAIASVAHRTNEVIAIYPITPSSPMGELADAWSAAGRKNIFGTVPEVIEMQSEGGAAGALHGALQAGSLATTFTASQGLLLMIPNMYKIAGELTPTVIHVAARTVATHALSIFGDHSDVMATRPCGWTMLASASVQESHDMALVAQALTLRSRVPVLHFMDGFRTSHEVNSIAELTDDDLRALLDEKLIREHRERAMNPDRPVLRGTAQNPDVFFQAREACNPFYEAVPGILQEVLEQFAARTGRCYRPYEYMGAPDAERVVVLMGSGVGAAREAVEALVARGEKVGLLQVRLFQPFAAGTFAAALPESVRRLAVLDRTKEPGAMGEPLHLAVLAALDEAWAGRAPGRERPRVVGGRYGLSSKEFTPAMVAGVLAELEKEEPRNHFTVGIVDDVTGTSLEWDPDFDTEPDDVTRAVFFGLGSDGTVGANKNSVKILCNHTDLHAQGYFVYDSKKAGAVTVSHLRFGPRPIHSTYLIRRAGFVACHQFQFLEKLDVLEPAAEGATFLLNAPYGPDEIWERIPVEVQEQILARKLRFFVVDAGKVAAEAGMGSRINTVMQTCFFALADILPAEEAVGSIKDAIRETYGKLGETVVQRNFAAVDGALAALHEVPVPGEARGELRRLPPVPEVAPDFVQRVTAIMLAGKGDLLPVSALPPDGTFPVGTARWEKRSIAREIPIWDPAICTECSLCALVCPHAAIRIKAYGEEVLAEAPAGFKHRRITGKGFPAPLLTVQVAPDDCTGCGVCVDVCPARSKEVAKHKAIDMEYKLDHLERERGSFDFFLQIPDPPRVDLNPATVKGSQLMMPLFEFSGACAGCGETPYVKLASQLFGDRMLVANATGCSSIYGGNLPTTPWTANAEGRGPAWNNSLFEDNAEFGLGMRLAADKLRDHAVALLQCLAHHVGENLAGAILAFQGGDETTIRAQRERIALLRQRLADVAEPAARVLDGIADWLVPRSIWIMGGDGWAYDIGFGGLDHVLASGRDVNVLVLDTGVYSNTGGQASKATPRAAVAKFAAGGKPTRQKDLGMIAMAYGSVYVAQVAIGANPAQCIRTFLEAEAYPGPSLIIAYSHCIAHGINMSTSMGHQREAVQAGFWPLYRFDPRLAHDGGHPFQLDSRKPKLSFEDFAAKEARFAILKRTRPEEAERLFHLAQRDIDERWRYYQQLAGIERDNADIEEQIQG